MGNLFDDDLFNDDLFDNDVNEVISEQICNNFDVDKFISKIELMKYFVDSDNIYKTQTYKPYKVIKDISKYINKIKKDWKNNLVFVFKNETIDEDICNISCINLIFINEKKELLNSLYIEHHSILIPGDKSIFTIFTYNKFTKDNIETFNSFYKHALTYRRRTIPSIYGKIKIDKHFLKMDEKELLKIIYNLRKALKHLDKNDYTFEITEEYKFKLEISEEFLSTSLAEKKYYVDTYYLKS